MKTGTLFITDDSSVTLTFYIHGQSGELPNTKVRPAVLVMPGGGYHACSEREAEPIALAYMAEGYQTFVLRYSIQEKSTFPQPLQDAEKALQTMIDRANEWGIDKTKIIAVGFSAGGHLAAALGTMGKVRPHALILGYPCILASISKILATPVPGLADKVDKNTPPTFLFSTASDTLVPVENTLAFAVALDKAAVPFEVHIFQDGEHGISLAKPLTSSGFKTMVDPVVAQWFKMSVDWLHRLFGDFDCSLESVAQGVITEFEQYGIDVAIGKLLENEECRKVLFEFVPILQDEKTAKQTIGISLRVMSVYAKDLLTESILSEIDERLKTIKIK